MSVDEKDLDLLKEEDPVGDMPGSNQEELEELLANPELINERLPYYE